MLASMDVAQEELRGPLVLLVAARRAPGQVRLAIAQRERGRERRSRALARLKRGRVTFFEPEHLTTGTKAEAKFGDHRRGLQPTARLRCRNHFAGLIDDI